MKKTGKPQKVSYTDAIEVLYQELEALKIRIAFAEMFEEERSNFGMLEMSEDGKQDVLNAIEKHLHRKRRAYFLQKTLPRVARIASMLLLVFFIDLTTAIASVRSVRIGVLNIIMGIEESYTELGIANETAEIPSAWQGSYYPMYIPEGFELEYLDPLFSEVRYQNAEGKYLIFREYAPGEFTNIDTEDAVVSTVIIDGAEAIVVEKDNRYTVVWTIDEQYMLLRLDTSMEDAVEVARSVKNVKL